MNLAEYKLYRAMNQPENLQANTPATRAPRPQQQQAARRLKKTTNPIVGVFFVMLGMFLGLAGLVGLLFNPILGLAACLFGGLLLILAFVVDTAFHVCGACGNRVEKTSTVCPCCQSHLRK